ncbi:MAG: 50S ribosomal protein L11 methyltransferase [Candidatus Gracilibacteria bacterium]|nr:50S ribosomal protein L11 methyltransferase [Candidatus Gracilibacteria bacterium]
MIEIGALQLGLGQIIAVILAVLLITPMLIGFIYGAPFVPTPQAAVDKMIALAKLKKGMKVMDPGCGDARMLITASKRAEVTAVGYELFFFAYFLARLRNFFSRGKAKIHFRDSRKVDLSDVDVIFCYLLPDPLKKLAPKWATELKKGSKVISYAFQIKGWKPIHEEPKVPEKNLARILVYEMGKE